MRNTKAKYIATLIALAIWFGIIFYVSHANAAAEPWQLIETRYCGTPERDASGQIKRSTAVLNAFKKIHPCPSNGSTSGACPGWALNHVIPLACGGCDSVANLDWMPDEIKSCAQPWCRDRYERKIYDQVPSIDGTNACTNQILGAF